MGFQWLPQTLRAFKYRDRATIIGDILKAIKVRGEAKKTQIMDEAKLSYVQTKKYLNYLVNCGFLIITERRTYTLTDKGYSFLNLIEVQRIQALR